jgi:hypothetical protein
VIGIAAQVPRGIKPADRECLAVSGRHFNNEQPCTLTPARFNKPRHVFERAIQGFKVGGMYIPFVKCPLEGGKISARKLTSRLIPHHPTRQAPQVGQG